MITNWGSAAASQIKAQQAMMQTSDGAQRQADQTTLN
jgi:hypothetical protein